MKKNLRVLITGAGSTTAISVMKGLRKQREFEVFIVGTDTNERTDIAGSNFCDKFYTVAQATAEKKYLKTLEDLIKSELIDLLIPIVDNELEVIARNRYIIERATFLLLSSYDTISTCYDKFKTYEFFNNSNIPTVKTILVDQNCDIESLVQDITFPIILKPRMGVSSRDVYEIKNKDELFLLKRVKNPIIQEMAKGQEYTIDIFYDGKKIISAVPRKRIETRAGISYKGQTEKDETLINYACQIAEKLNIKGPANIQCFKNGDEIRFIEINPRFSGSLPLTIEAGVNMPLFTLKMAVGEELEPVEDFKIVKMCRYWEEIFYSEC
ncbi:MAG: ATP-grasp domain-containing protein [Candidatus Bathyarchaeia archaeon]